MGLEGSGSCWTDASIPTNPARLEPDVVPGTVLWKTSSAGVGDLTRCGGSLVLSLAPSYVDWLTASENGISMSAYESPYAAIWTCGGDGDDRTVEGSVEPHVAESTCWVGGSLDVCYD